MAIENIRPQIEREPQIRPQLDQPEIVDALRHGNIYDVLRAPGVNRRDIEDYLSTQWRVFQNQIVQDYQIYAPEASIPPPDLHQNFPIHSKEMSLSTGDHQLFQQEMLFLQNYEPEVSGSEGSQPKVRFKEMRAKATEGAAQGPGQDVAGIAEGALNEWQDFYSEMSMKAIDGQMMRELRSKTGDLNKEIQRLISMVMSGQIDPEYVLIAAAKSNMLQNGTFFSWKGKRLMHLNDEMNKISKEMIKTSPNDLGAMQAAQMKTRSGGTQMQLELMDIQKFAQNIATTLDWVSNAIRMMAQMRQTPTQAIAAR